MEKRMGHRHSANVSLALDQILSQQTATMNKLKVMAEENAELREKVRELRAKVDELIQDVKARDSELEELKKENAHLRSLLSA